MLVRTIDDETYNHIVSVTDATADLWIAYVAPGKLKSWSGTWEKVGVLKPLNVEVLDAWAELDNSALVRKQGCCVSLGVLIREGLGAEIVSSRIQSWNCPGPRIHDIPVDWGVGANVKLGAHVSTDVLQLRMRYRRRLA